MLIKATLLITVGLFTGSIMAHESHKHESHAHHQHQLNISDATIRAFLPAAKSTAAYFTLTNPLSKKVVLRKAKIEGVGRVEIHEHVHKEGMMRMQQVDHLEVPAKQTVVFQPGGYHLMAFEPAQPLKSGDKRKLTLYFDNGDRVHTLIEVVSLKDTFEKSAHSHHKHH